MLKYQVPEYKRIRVIVDTDAACEADDPFAIAQALLTRKFEVKGILAEQFGFPESTEKSYQEILTVLRCMDMDVPVFMGEKGNLQDVEGQPLSDGGKFLIEEALRQDEKPLYVLCLGAITNVARALQFCPDIRDKITVLWIAGQDMNRPIPSLREFNSGNDIEAGNFVLQSGAKVWLIPFPVYSSMNISLSEIQKRIYPCGKIGQHLFENMEQYNRSPGATWTAGESWSLGDNPAIGLAMNPGCGRYTECPAPHIEKDTTMTPTENGPIIRIYEWVDSRFILEDMMCKLEMVYGG